MEKFFDKTGVMAIGTRLRMLSERVTKESEKIFNLYHVDIKPKWYPIVFTLLQDDEPKTVTSIASEIGHSHVSVVKIVKEMSKAGFLIETKDKFDGRKTNISLSEKGKEILAELDNQHRDTTLAIEKMLTDTTHNLWLAIDEFETRLNEKSTYPRVLEEKRQREAKKVKIVNFENKYLEVFKKLNKEWITKYFKLEDKDMKSLENPKETILKKGGKILIALYEDKPVGVCALMISENSNYDYEMAKMAVCDEAKGKGIGLILGEAIINKAKSLGANAIFLESNTILKPAVNLYQKLGFKKIAGYSSPYERSNIQMELIL